MVGDEESDDAVDVLTGEQQSGGKLLDVPG